MICNGRGVSEFADTGLEGILYSFFSGELVKSCEDKLEAGRSIGGDGVARPPRLEVGLLDNRVGVAEGGRAIFIPVLELSDSCAPA